MTGKVPADPHIALAAHLNALMGTFFLLGVAWTLPMLRYGPVGQRRLAWLVIGANFANWAVTCVKAWLHVSGVDFIGQAANDAIFLTLTVTVVLPALAAAGSVGVRLPPRPLKSAGLLGQLRAPRASPRTLSPPPCSHP